MSTQPATTNATDSFRSRRDDDRRGRLLQQREHGLYDLDDGGFHGRVLACDEPREKPLVHLFEVRAVGWKRVSA